MGGRRWRRSASLGSVYDKITVINNNINCQYYRTYWTNWNVQLIIRLFTDSRLKVFLFKKNGIRFNRQYGVIFDTHEINWDICELYQEILEISALNEANRYHTFSEITNNERICLQEFNNEYYLRGHPTYEKYRKNLKQLLQFFFQTLCLKDVVGIVFSYM